MNNLRDELNALPQFEGLNRLERPPIFSWAPERNTDDWDALCGDDDESDEEANDNMKIRNTKLSKLQAEIKK